MIPKKKGCGFVQKELSLEELRQIEMDLLLHLRNFLTNHNLSYFLSNGTLLGAVKYQGFIPWDDDIDIFIPRKDYDVLIKEFADSENLKLFSPERVKGYAFPFAKLCDMTTRRIEKNNNNGVDLGVDIDIFPLDYWEKDSVKQAKKQMKTMTMLRLAKNLRISSPNPLKSVLKKISAVYCKTLGAAHFINKLQKGALKADSTTDNAGCVVWPVYGTKEILPKKLFENTTEVTFEGETFPAPAGFDSYLRSLYGDYEKDPPKEKQRTHHHFKAYRI